MAAIGIGTLGLLAAVSTAAWLLARRQIRLLRTALHEKAQVIDRDARLLIEKNVELFDQNIERERLVQSRADFIAIVSHQLRTPVTEIRWGLAGLFDAPGGYTPPTRDYMERLYGNATKMVRLIDTLLRFVSAEQASGALPVHPYDPDRIIRDVVADTVRNFADRHIDLQTELDFARSIDSIDQDSFTMIVANLVENAFYYTAAGGRIGITSGSEGADRISVAVRDSGMGIPAALQPYIFSKFSRSPDAVKAHAEGSGLGLYVVKRIVERHGGTISFESEAGKGSIFHCTLPIHPAQSRRAHGVTSV